MSIYAKLDLLNEQLKDAEAYLDDLKNNKQNYTHIGFQELFWNETKRIKKLKHEIIEESERLIDVLETE